MAYTSPFDIPDDDPEFQAFKTQFLGTGKKQNDPGFVTGIKQGLGGFTSGVGQVAEDAGWKNNPIKSYGDEVQANNPNSAASQSWEGFKESPWQGVKEFAGQGIGSTLPSLAAFLLPGGQGAAATGLARVGQVARGLPMQTALAAAPIYGQVREDQQHQGFDDIPAAAAAAIGGGIVESKLGIQRVLGKATDKPIQSFVGELASSPLKTGLKTWGRTGLEEGAEEIIQQPMQQLGAHRNPLTEESLRDTAWSGFGGLVGGLAMGGVGGAKMGLAHKRVDNFRQADLLNPETPLNTLDSQAQWNQAFIERDQGAEAGQRFYDQRQAEIDQYVESLVDPYRRQVFADQNRQIDLLADQERIAARAPSYLGQQSDYNPDDERVLNAVDRPNAADYRNWWENVPDPNNPEAYQQFWQHVTNGQESVRDVKRDALGTPLNQELPPGYTPISFRSNGNAATQVAQESGQGASGVAGGSAGNTQTQPGVGRGGDNVAATSVLSSGANQLVGNTTGPDGTGVNVTQPTQVVAQAQKANDAKAGTKSGTALAAQGVKPGTKGALEAAVTELMPEESTERQDHINAIQTAKSYTTARKALAKMSPQGLKIALRSAPQEEQRVVQTALGWDSQGNQVGSRIASYADVAKASGLNSRQRVQQILKSYGIDSDVINRMNAADQQAVSVSELMPSQQEDGGAQDGTGFRIMDTPNASDDFDVKDLNSPWHVLKQAEQARLRGDKTVPSNEEIIKTLREAKKPVQDTNDNVQTAEERVLEERKTTQANDQREEMLREVASDYNSDIEEGDAPFERLDTDLQEKYIDAFEDFNEDKISARDLMRIFSEVADEAKARNAVRGGDQSRLEGRQNTSGQLPGLVQSQEALLEQTQDASRPEQTSSAEGSERVKYSIREGGPSNEEIDAFENGMLTLDEFLPERFPSVASREISFPGPGGRITPKAIPGYQFFRETNGEGLFDLLAYDKQYNFNRTFVATKPDIALGQGGNTGINVVFRSKSLSGRENVKPGTGKLAGREYVTEVIAPRAVVEVSMRPAQEKSLRPLVRRVLASEFDRTTDENGKLVFTRKLGYSRKNVAQQSRGVEGSTQASAIESKLKPLFFSNSRFSNRVVVVQSAAALPQNLQSSIDGNTQAFVQGGKVYMIADNIAEGKELAVFLHEVGVHLGMKGLIGQENLNRLAMQIKRWAVKNDGSVESEIAKKALARVKSAQQGGVDMELGDVIEERVAYFVEEAVNAGINPTALSKSGGPLQQWFRTLWAAVKVALRKFGLDRVHTLTAQNLVDLSYGAARLELEGTWHGTAADFRNFDHSYMGSGEGAQAFGWGTYLAQRVGIAKGYWKDDVRRKYAAPKLVDKYGNAIERSWNGPLGSAHNALVQANGDFSAARATQTGFGSKHVLAALDAMEKDGVSVRSENQEGSLMRVDTAVHEDEMLDWDKSLSEQSEAVLDAIDFNGLLDLKDVKLDGSGQRVYHALTEKLGSDKAASEYLDSIGIKGIKFLDAQSRDAEQLAANAKRHLARLEESYANASANYEANPSEGNLREKTRVEKLVTTARKQAEFIPTRNLVIFNDKNIQRVVTQVGADRERIKFSFAGKNAETVDPDKLSKAESLEKAGVDQQSIWEQTGWYRGADNAWRFEISDNGASFTNKGNNLSEILGGVSKKLGVVLNHPELFKAYPKLRSVDVIPVAKAGHGKYSSNNGYPKINLDPSMPADEAVSVLMHEVQHAIQEIENFARGGNPSIVAADMAERSELLAEVGSELNTAVTDIRSELGADAYRSLLRKVRDEGYRYSHVAFQLGTVDEDAQDVAEIVLTAAKELGYDRVAKAAEAYLTVSEELVQPGSFIDKEKRAFDMYQRLAGEVEARNVQARIGQNNKINPRGTEDTSAERQIVKFSGGESSSAKFSKSSNIAQTNPQYRKTSTLVRQTLEYLGNKFQSVENNTMFGHQLAQKAERLMPGTSRYFKSLIQRQTERVKHEQEIARIANRYNELETRDQNALNAFVQKSTMDGKWGFKPTWFEKDVQTPVDPAMKTEFDKLTSEAQQIAKDMFKFGSEQQKRFDASVNANITDPKKKVPRNHMYGKPYAPLKRFGDHVVVGKSAEFVAEEKAHPGSKRLEEMKADENHYYVEFTDGNWESIKRRDEMAATNPNMTWDSKPLQLENRALNSVNMTILEKLKNQIEASDNKSTDATKGALKSLANQLYIQQLNQMHANKSQAKRLKVKGAEADMMKAFVSQGRAEAALIANLMTHAESEAGLQQIQTAARTGDNQDAKTRVANAVLRRHLAMLDFQPTPIQNKLMGANSFMMLLTSPAYYLTNATQPFVVSMPYMAGRFGGANSWNTLRDAYKTTLELVKLSTLFKDQNLDAAHLKKFNSVGREAEALQVLLDENLVNVGMEMELGDIASQSKNPAMKNLQKGLQVLKTGVANVEVLNRLSTAVAAYRLAYAEALNKGSSKDAAHEAGTSYARQTIIDTHGDYAGYNAPTVMMQGAFGSMPVKLMTQFKKFQFIQAGLLIGTFRDAYLRGNLNENEKAAAKAMFKWMLGTQAALAGALGGVTGVPMALLGAMVAGIFGDDGEDKEAFLRRILGGGAFAQLILHGVPAAAGVDISKRVGMGAALDPFRMADPQTDWSDYALSLAGPSAGLASRTASGLNYIGKGQYWKGLEMLMPSGILTNASKIARYEAEGLTNSRGDVVMKPEEISLITDLMQGLGLETTQLSDRRWKAGAIYDRGIHFKEKTSQLQRQYVDAFKDGDREELTAIRQEWMKLQAERVNQGFKRENMTALTQAPMAQKKRERETVNGLQTTQTNKQFVASMDAL